MDRAEVAEHIHCWQHHADEHYCSCCPELTGAEPGYVGVGQQCPVIRASSALTTFEPFTQLAHETHPNQTVYMGRSINLVNRVSMYADNVVLFLRPAAEDIEITMDILKLFGGRQQGSRPTCKKAMFCPLDVRTWIFQLSRLCCHAPLWIFHVNILACLFP
jgi:hypothetical protein